MWWISRCNKGFSWTCFDIYNNCVRKRYTWTRKQIFAWAWQGNRSSQYRSLISTRLFLFIAISKKNHQNLGSIIIREVLAANAFHRSCRHNISDFISSEIIYRIRVLGFRWYFHEREIRKWLIFHVVALRVMQCYNHLPPLPKPYCVNGDCS